MKPVLSIIVPCYNVEKYVKKCLNSIINQTIKEIEIICVNDGSRDGTAGILQEYSEKDNRVIVITQDNQGLGAARNTGINAARGEYIGFVDSDDFVDIKAFEELYKKAKETDADIVISNINIYEHATGNTYVFRDNQFYELLENEGCFSAKDYPKIFQYIGVWDRIYRRDFIEENKLRNPVKRIYEDVLFTVETLCLAQTIAVVNKPLYFYRRGTGESIVDKEIVNDDYKADFAKNLRESKEFLIKQQKWDEYKKEFLAFQLSGLLMHQNNFQSKQRSLEFSKEVSDILDEDDICSMIDTTSMPFAKKYLKLLKKKKYNSIYTTFKVRKIFVKIHNLVRVEKYYIVFRFPKTKKEWKIKRIFHSKWQAEMDARHQIIDELREISKLLSNLSK